MPKFEVGNLWHSKADVILVTSNGSITSHNKLVMGRGAALEMRSRYPGIDRALAKTIRMDAHYDYPKDLNQKWWVYGFVLLGSLEALDCNVNVEKRSLGLFQVKYRWSEKADLALIGYSTTMLKTWLCFSFNRNLKVAMNFPGIGNGRLYREQVLPIIESLDDRVTVYELAHH